MLRISSVLFLVSFIALVIKCETLLRDDILDAIKDKADAAKDIVQNSLEETIDNNKDVGSELEKLCIEAKGEYFIKTGLLKIRLAEIGLRVRLEVMNWTSKGNMTMANVNNIIDATLQPITGPWLEGKQSEIRGCLDSNLFL